MKIGKEIYISNILNQMENLGFRKMLASEYMEVNHVRRLKNRCGFMQGKSTVKNILITICSPTDK